MTNRIETLKALQARIRASTGADRELDADICVTLRYTDQDALCHKWMATYPKWIPYNDGHIQLSENGPHFKTPSLTASIDSCLALLKEILSGWRFEIRQLQVEDFQARVLRLALKRTPRDDIFASHRCATHALLLAIIEAVIAEEEAKQPEKTT